MFDPEKEGTYLSLTEWDPPDLQFENRKPLWNPADYAEFQVESVQIDSSTDILQGAKPNLSTRHLMDEEVDQAPFHILGFEVGDDRVDFHRKSRLLSLLFIVQESVFKMKTSVEDTFISRTCFNLAEVTSQIPRSVMGGFHQCRGRGSFANIEFNDFVLLRTVIDVSKQKGDHSSSVAGKASLVGTKASSPRTSDGILSTIFFCCWYQDGTLRTVKSPEPKYLHKVVGGSGVRALWNNAANIFSYVRCYRGGKYHRLYGTATKEMMTGLHSLERGQPAIVPLIGTLRKKQEYLFGTYGSAVVVPHRKLDRDHGVLPEPIYEGREINGLMGCAEHRLIRTRRLIRRSQAEIEYEKYRKLQLMFSSADSVAICKARSEGVRRLISEEFNGALSANTAFQSLLSRTHRSDPGDVHKLIREGYQVVYDGEIEFGMDHAKFMLVGHHKGSDYRLHDLVPGEDVFIQDEVSVQASLKVEGIVLETVMSGRIKHQTTTSKLGLYEITKSDEEWADGVVKRLRDLREAVGKPTVPTHLVEREFLSSTEWYNDDDAILYQIQSYVHSCVGRPAPVLVITDDIRLCKKAADRFDVIIYRMPSKMFIQKYANVMKCETIREEDVKNVKLSFLRNHFSVELESVYRYVSPGLLTYDMGAIRENSKNLFLEESNTLSVIEPTDCRFRSTFRRKERLRVTSMEKVDQLKFYIPRPTDPGMSRFTKADKPRHIYEWTRNLSTDEKRFLREKEYYLKKAQRRVQASEKLRAHAEVNLDRIINRTEESMRFNRTPPLKQEQSLLTKAVTACLNLGTTLSVHPSSDSDSE